MTSATSSTVSLLTHGGGFDRSYWNSAFQPEKYNFVQFAINQGYSVFNYDRLGTGQSSTISGFVSQASIQIEVLDELASQIRRGQYTASLGVPKKLVLVGHSFGSFVTNGLLAQVPNIADAIVLTGIGFNQTPDIEVEAFGLGVAAQQDSKWRGLDSGHLIWSSIYNNVNIFIETVKAPIAITELASIGALNYTVYEFKGPVFNGEYDFLVCGGYFPGVIDQPIRSYFNSSSAFKAEILSETGHGINYHKTATQRYAIITDFLKERGF